MLWLESMWNWSECVRSVYTAVHMRAHMRVVTSTYQIHKSNEVQKFDLVDF